MDENVKGTGHSDVEELLLPGEVKRKAARQLPADEVESSMTISKALKTPPAIAIMIIIGLALIGLLVIFSDASLKEQFTYILRGELSEYKERKAEEEEKKIRDIEELTGNKYGSVTLTYTPKDARVDIKQSKYVKDCSSFGTDEDAILACLKKPFDYAKAPEVTDIPNKSQSLKREEKEVVENLPFTDMPIQQSNEERTVISAYEVTIEITRDGYEPRKFHFTGEKARIGALGEGWESKFWDQKGPGLYMVDFPGADLAPKPETAKINYIAAVKEFECIRREVQSKRDAGKTVSEEQVAKIFTDILNKNDIRTRDDFYKIEAFLRQTDAVWFEGFLKELEKLDCSASTN